MVVFWDIWGWVSPVLSGVGECMTVVGMNAVVCYLLCGIYLTFGFWIPGVEVVVI